MFVVVAVTTPRSHASSPPAERAVAEATGAALQADGRRAVSLLRRVPEREFDSEDRAFRACMLDRFGGAPGIERSGLADPFARQTLDAYRTYWSAVLSRPSARAEAEATLLRALRHSLGRDDFADFDALEPALVERLERSGFHALLGRTLPLLELMLWSQQETRSIRVELPEGAHVTDVVFLDKFASLGWADYATCGRRGAGGWATAQALHAVVPRYSSLNGEEFRVSFLGHETQHFVDLARFPSLAPWELEYRAKLVELARADATRARVLRKLTEDQGDDPGSPHAYANKRVLAALRQRLGLPPGGRLDVVAARRLRAVAADELRADTQRRIPAQ
jgi:hypothetical protein